MDIAFIKLYKNDFNAAKKCSDTNAVFIEKSSYIQQRTDETFYQKTTSLVDINFVGAIKVELIDCRGLVQKDISDNFYCDGYIKDGIYQIDFEFGKINKDFWYKPLYLKITDLVNLNEFYSNSFLITNDKSELSSRFEYTASYRIAGVGYDLKAAYQTVRFRELYHKDNVNKRNGSEYTDTSGRLVSLRNTITYIRKYIFTKFDLSINDRIEQLFRHPAIFMNGERVTLSEFKAESIAGDTNFKTGELFVNPKEEYFSVGNQLFVDFDAVIVPNGNYTAALFPDNITLTFNKPSVLGVGTIKIFNSINVLIATFTQGNISIVGNSYVIDNSAFVTNLDSYYFIISEGLFTSENGEKFSVTEINQRGFSILIGDWLNTDWNNSDWLTN